jgi:hypothetical protein
MQDIKLVNDLSTKLYDFVQSEEAQTYWARKFKDDITLQNVDWDAMEAARKEVSWPRRLSYETLCWDVQR